MKVSVTKLHRCFYQKEMSQFIGFFSYIFFKSLQTQMRIHIFSSELYELNLHSRIKDVHRNGALKADSLVLGLNVFHLGNSCVPQTLWSSLLELQKVQSYENNLVNKIRKKKKIMAVYA